MPGISPVQIRRSPSFPPELTTTSGLKVHNHLNEELTTQVRRLEDAIDYILTYRGDSKRLLDHIVGIRKSDLPAALEVFVFHWYFDPLNAPLCRERVYLVVIAYLKIDQKSITDVYIDRVSEWLESISGRRLAVGYDLRDAIKYVAEIKTENDEVTFDAEPYNLEQARVHVKAAKFGDEHWSKAKRIHTEKYTGAAPLRTTGLGFHQCNVMQRLFAADMEEIVNGNNTAHDRWVAKKNMLSERIIVREPTNQHALLERHNTYLERDTLCKESFQQRFDVMVLNDDKYNLYESYYEIHKIYFGLQQVLPLGDDDDERINTIISNIKSVAQDVIDCAQVLLDNPELKSLYVVSRSYHHAMALIFNIVGNSIKVRAYDSVSSMFYITFYLHQQDLTNPRRRGEIGGYLINLPHFYGLTLNQTIMHFGDFTCRVPGTLTNLVSKKYENNNLDIILNKFGSQWSASATALIIFTLAARDYNVAKKIFSNKDFLVSNLNEKHFKFQGDNSDVVGLVVYHNEYDLVHIMLNNWNREYIDQGINKVIINSRINRNPVDCAVYVIKNLSIAELLIQHGGRPSKFMENGEILPEFKELKKDVLELLLMENNRNEILKVEKPPAHFNVTDSSVPSELKKLKSNTSVNPGRESFFKLQIFNKFIKPVPPIGASAN